MENPFKLIIERLYRIEKAISFLKIEKAIDSKSKPIQKKEDNENVSKNRFLYPSDGLGKMEQDIVYESKTYQSRESNYKAETENFEIVQKKVKSN